MQDLPLERVLELGEFTPHLDETFRLPLEDGEDLELVLIIAEPVGVHPPPEGFREPFSLVFRGPADRVLSQRLYPLEHPDLGRMAIFLVPIGPDAEGMRYESVFN